ncbi:PREDICTED: uncharacterized protein LOC106818266 isoform X2 [Priapulus caudatus]|nr:PREDICTED: uncharacterized protein LOC106818266 isoform X2 [Priapulus caudatus]
MLHAVLALAHYAHDLTKGKLILTDLQGVGKLLTDIEIATDEMVGEDGSLLFAAGNCSKVAIANFEMTHKCNEICTEIGLKGMMCKPQSETDVGNVDSQMNNMKIAIFQTIQQGLLWIRKHKNELKGTVSVPRPRHSQILALCAHNINSEVDIDRELADITAFSFNNRCDMERFLKEMHDDAMFALNVILKPDEPVKN